MQRRDPPVAGPSLHEVADVHDEAAGRRLHREPLAAARLRLQTAGIGADDRETAVVAVGACACAPATGWVVDDAQARRTVVEEGDERVLVEAERERERSGQQV